MKTYYVPSLHCCLSLDDLHFQLSLALPAPIGISICLGCRIQTVFACRNKKVVFTCLKNYWRCPGIIFWFRSLFTCLISMLAMACIGEPIKWGRKVPIISLVNSSFVFGTFWGKGLLDILRLLGRTFYVSFPAVENLSTYPRFSVSFPAQEIFSTTGE